MYDTLEKRLTAAGQRTTKLQHEAAKCIRDVKGTQYVGKSYKSQFECPTCHRKTWQHLGFLGQRDVICNGVKFTKEEKKVSAEWEEQIKWLEENKHKLTPDSTR